MSHIRLECGTEHLYEKHKSKSRAQSPNWLSKSYGNKYWESYWRLNPSEKFDSIVYYHIPVRRLGMKHEHANEWLKYELETRNKLQIETVTFPDEVKSFVERSNLPKDTLDRIGSTIEHIEEFLKTHREECDIKTELSVDPEEESEEIKLRIQIKKDLDYIYNRLKLPIYKIAVASLPKEILQKILIKFESI